MNLLREENPSQYSIKKSMSWLDNSYSHNKMKCKCNNREDKLNLIFKINFSTLSFHNHIFYLKNKMFSTIFFPVFIQH